MTQTLTAHEMPRLSEREREILIAYLRLRTMGDVARAVYVQPCTVSTHLSRIRRKYEAVGRPAPSKTRLLVLALQDGLITLDEFA